MPPQQSPSSPATWTACPPALSAGRRRECQAVVAVLDVVVVERLDGVAPPGCLEVHLHQHRPLFVICACEYGLLDAGVWVLSALDHEFAAPSPWRWRWRVPLATAPSAPVRRARSAPTGPPFRALDHGFDTRCQPDSWPATRAELQRALNLTLTHDCRVEEEHGHREFLCLGNCLSVFCNRVELK